MTLFDFNLDRGFEHWSGQTKIYICRFSEKHTTNEAKNRLKENLPTTKSKTANRIVIFIVNNLQKYDNY